MTIKQKIKSVLNGRSTRTVAVISHNNKTVSLVKSLSQNITVRLDFIRGYSNGSLKSTAYRIKNSFI